jgi:hypothetical protein
MALRKKTVRVLPNPWAFIHPEFGPQAACHVDTNGRGGAVAFVGAERVAKITEKRENDIRGSRQETRFVFSDKPVEVAATSPYYLDRLQDGSLVPADAEALASLPSGHCKFKSLGEAQAAGVAAFDAEHGTGAWAELEKSLFPKTEKKGNQ